MAKPHPCNASCRRAVRLPPVKCKCVCEGWNHGKEPRLPGFTLQDTRPAADTTNEDDKQGGRDAANEDMSHVQGTTKRDTGTKPAPAADKPTAQVYRGVRYLTVDAGLVPTVNAYIDRTS